MSTSSPIAARFAGPELLERGRTATIRCALYRDGALVVPDSGTVAIYRSDGTLVVSAAVTVASSMATYTTPSFSAEQLGEGWRVEWMLVVAGATHTFDRPAALCRRRLFPVLVEADLVRRHSDLAALRPSSLSSYQDYLDDSWEEILHQIRQKGSLPQLIASPEDLKYVHLYRALELIFRDFAVSQSADGKWPFLAADYAKQYQQAWNQLSLKYDSNEDGKADGERRPLASVTFLASGGEGWQGRYR